MREKEQGIAWLWQGLAPGIEPGAFNMRVWCSNSEIPPLSKAGWKAKPLSRSPRTIKRMGF